MRHPVLVNETEVLIIPFFSSPPDGRFSKSILSVGKNSSSGYHPKYEKRQYLLPVFSRLTAVPSRLVPNQALEIKPKAPFPRSHLTWSEHIWTSEMPETCVRLGCWPMDKKKRGSNKNRRSSRKVGKRIAWIACNTISSLQCIAFPYRRRRRRSQNVARPPPP